MWVLRSSPPSPFGRKIKIAAHLCGLFGRLQIEATNTADPEDSVRQQNPLGKIPVLITEDGTTLYDSRVILEWLDEQAGRGAIIPTEQGRFAALTMQSLADGIIDASILQVYERRFRPEEKQHQPWLDYQADKVRRGLEWLEANVADPGASPHVGEIALACALGYLDFRFDGEWRGTYPRLQQWLADFSAAVPAFEATGVH
ncbi:Glutathione S-transferase [Faunimonas pinastri]|uniref:Glutathione S-transferase n=1 Tax=Faunimonas pinastri TaxID=1855383 RepID=A0A1H9AWE0_9HYPH|nr:glutathione S-transferase N-terminal domain-containing protein [Faunimonas pinastri]SEP80258.1 Glutathione S-transferase [Faunimonas pinastri]